MHQQKYTNQLQANADDHPKHSYPNTLKRPFVKTHTIILNSQDRRSGTTLNSAIFDIAKSIPIKSERAVMYVESFLLDYDEANTNVPDATFDDYFYFVRVLEISQPLSYDSHNKGTTNVVLVNNGHTFRNSTGVGTIPVVDTQIFSQRPLTVQLSSAI